MAKDPDNLAADFDTESSTGLLAEEHESGRSMLWRLGSWGLAAVGAVTVAVMANQSSLTLKRDQVAAIDAAHQAQQLQTLAKESHNETRRLASAIDTLSSDRDRLYSRVSTLEQGLDSVTGAIAKQPPLVPPMSAPAAALVAPTAPPAPAQPAAAAPAVAPVATAQPAPSDKPATSDKPAASDKAAVPAEKAATATEKYAAAADKKSAPAIRPQPASDAKPQATSDTKPPVADKPQAASDKPATAVPDNSQSSSQSSSQAAAAPAPAVAASPAAAAAPARADDGKPSAPTSPAMLTADNSMIGPPAPAAGKPLEPIKPPTANDVKTTPMPELATADPADDAEVDDAGAPKAQIQRTEFGVDLGTANSVNGLRALWRGLLKAKANAPLAALRPIIVVKENSNGLGMQLRLVAGPLNDAGTAAKICAGLSLTQRACETAIYDGQRLTMKPGDDPAAGKPVQPQRRILPKRAAAAPPVVEEKKPEPTTFSSMFRRNGQ